MATSTNLRRIDGSDGADKLVGTMADERIDGKGGDDSIFGNGGHDLVYGGAGNDRIDCGQAWDQATGAFITNTSAVQAYGDEGNDQIYGGSGDDLLDGGTGDDELHGMGGADRIAGGDGNDKLWSSRVYDPVTKTYSADTKGDVLDGGNGNDVLQGESGNDQLLGGNGDDTLYGLDGNDVLDGGTGRNKLYGGKGDDKYVIRSLDDTIWDEAGDDSALITVDWYKPSDSVEHWTWADGVQKLPYWIDSLIFSNAPAAAATTQATRTVSFCFAQQPAEFFTEKDRKEFAPFNAKQVDYARKMLAYVETVVNLHFVETTDPSGPNTIVFGSNAQELSGGYGTLLGPSHGSVLMLGLYPSYLDPTRDDGKSICATLLHEIGHVLGLKHPFSHPEATGGIGPGPYLPDAEERYPFSIMSYSRELMTGTPVYGPLDIAALQFLYGPAAGGSGDSTYAVTADRSLMISDGAGIDTLDASQCTVGTTLFLAPGYWGYVGARSDTITSPGQVTVDFGTLIEKALGGSAADRIVGNDADNEIDGNAGDDTLEGGAGADRLKGGAGSDVLRGGAGNDLLDGGEGRDYARYSGAGAACQATRGADGWTVQDAKGDQGSDTLAGIERLVFDDLAVALDLDGVAGQAYRLYAAAFDRTPDLAGLGYWLAQMDKGMPLLDVANGFIQNDEFVKMYGATRTHTGFLDKLYHNILHRAPDQSGIDFWAKAMDNGVTEGQILAQFSESPENQAQVIAQIAHGIAYLPFALG